MDKALELGFTDREITPWGGMALMSRMLGKMGFREELRSTDLPAQGSNRGYDPTELIEQFLIGVWCGANRFEHLEVSRHDHVISRIFGYGRMAGHKAFVRYLSKFTQGTNHRVFNHLYGWFFEQLRFDNFTLDLDSTVIARYGKQEGARKGYNPRKPGRASHHPLMAFVSDSRMVANCWLRAGDAHTANNCEGFLEETLGNLRGKKIGLLRADSGFMSHAIMEHLERAERPIPYIIAARLHRRLQRALVSQGLWQRVAEGIEVAEVMYKSDGWQRARRMVMVRQKVSVRPEAAGKTLKLFADDEEISGYRYGCFVTSLELPPAEVWRLYRGRADAENRIRELKYDFGLEGFCMKSFSATEAALNFVMLAYNLMSLFRQAVVCGDRQQVLKTMRYRLFAVGGYIVKEGNRRILKLSMAMKRREWFKGLWAKSASFDLPATFPSNP